MEDELADGADAPGAVGHLEAGLAGENVVDFVGGVLV